MILNLGRNEKLTPVVHNSTFQTVCQNQSGLSDVVLQKTQHKHFCVVLFIHKATQSASQEHKMNIRSKLKTTAKRESKSFESFKIQ